MHLSSSAVMTTSSTLTCSDCNFPGLEALFVHICMVPCTVGCPVWSVPLSRDKDLTWARWGIQLLGEASVPRFTDISRPPPGVKLTQGCAAFNSKVSALGLGLSRVTAHCPLRYVKKKLVGPHEKAAELWSGLKIIFHPIESSSVGQQRQEVATRVRNTWPSMEFLKTSCC